MTEKTPHELIAEITERAAAIEAKDSMQIARKEALAKWKELAEQQVANKSWYNFWKGVRAANKTLWAMQVLVGKKLSGELEWSMPSCSQQ